MPFLYRHFLRPFLFRKDSEEIHNFTIEVLGRAGREPGWLNLLNALFSAPPMPVDLWGLRFPNPLGLAAGMDKHASAVPAWEALGFGFCELGGVTLHAQSGNPQPRMFRAVAEEALVNRMGFNNIGAEALAVRLAAVRRSGLWPRHPIGINLGKSKVTPIEEASHDYAGSMRALWNHGDFFVVNVSSPNTPNLRQLQDKAALRQILTALRTVNSEEALRSRVPLRPLLVKVAPDLSWQALDELLEVALDASISGIVATNTTLERPNSPYQTSRRTFAEAGGLSGAPLRKRSTEMIRYIFRKTNGRLPIVGVGGIFNATDAWEKITAGASLVQIYSGLVFEGPGIVREIVCGLASALERSGCVRLDQVVGSGGKLPPDGFFKGIHGPW
jgi:dihydroorotate dehydrogenase